jgi:hypothetical protein
MRPTDILRGIRNPTVFQFIVQLAEDTDGVKGSLQVNKSTGTKRFK